MSTQLYLKKLASAGIEGMKRNILPGLALQVFALSLVLSYYLIPAVKPAFEAVAALKTQYGFAYSAIATGLFGGIIPFTYLALTGKIRRELLLAEFLFYTFFWAYRGVEVDLLYRFQSFLFGDSAAFSVIVRKTSVDQFIYNPIWAAPTQALFFLWKDRAFSWKALKAGLNKEFITFSVPSVLISTWIVWIPSVSIIYSLPLPLQIPLFNLVLCFWVLILNFISGKKPQ